MVVHASEISHLPLCPHGARHEAPRHSSPFLLNSFLRLPSFLEEVPACDALQIGLSGNFAPRANPPPSRQVAATGGANRAQGVTEGEKEKKKGERSYPPVAAPRGGLSRPPHLAAPATALSFPPPHLCTPLVSSCTSGDDGFCPDLCIATLFLLGAVLTTRLYVLAKICITLFFEGHEGRQEREG